MSVLYDIHIVFPPSNWRATHTIANSPASSVYAMVYCKLYGMSTLEAVQTPHTLLKGGHALVIAICCTC